MPLFYHSRAQRGSAVLITLLLLLYSTTPATAALAHSTQRDGPQCDPQALMRLQGVRAPDPRLNALAAASFAQVRQEVLARTGRDVLAVLSDVLRAPGFRTNKPGVASRSWHKAGRAVDLNTGGPFTLQRDGAMFQVFVGSVDITAIFEAYGWQRIPAQSSVLGWWHYEYHPDGISWQSAMAQVWPTDVLAAAFPEIDWVAVGCTIGSLPPGDGLDLPPGACVPDPPIWESAGSARPGDWCRPGRRASTSISAWISA